MHVFFRLAGACDENLSAAPTETIRLRKWPGNWFDIQFLSARRFVRQPSSTEVRPRDSISCLTIRIRQVTFVCPSPSLPSRHPLSHFSREPSTKYKSGL